jgi:hypothetical protein
MSDYVKVQVSIPAPIMNRVDDYVKSTGINRSSFTAMAMLDYLNKVDCVAAVRSVALSIKRVADGRELTDEDIQKLKDFQVLAETVIGTKI